MSSARINAARVASAARLTLNRNAGKLPDPVKLRLVSLAALADASGSSIMDVTADDFGLLGPAWAGEDPEDYIRNRQDGAVTAIHERAPNDAAPV